MKKEKKAKVNTKKEVIDFRNEGIADVQFSSGMVKLSGFYRIHLTWQKILIAIALGFLFSVATLFFMQNTGLYSGGSTAVCQGIARLVHTVMKVNLDPKDYGTYSFLILLVYNLLFWGLYLIFNVALVVFFARTMNKEFIYLSAIYICVSQVVGICLGLIPGVADIQLFGNTSTVNIELKKAQVECIIFYPNIFPTYDSTLEAGKQFVWDLQLTKAADDWISTIVTSENLTKSFSLVIYALMYSFVYAFCNAGIFIIGGSSMGTESIAIYISEKKNKDVGTMLKFIQTGCLLAGIIMGSYVSGIIAGNSIVNNNSQVEATVGDYASWQYLINANLVASLIYVFINGALINALFPTRKLVRVEIFTQQAKGVLDNLRLHKYPHPTTVVNSFGGYSGAANNMIVTVMPVMALTNYINTIREVDKTCLIAVTALDDCVGRMGLEKHMNLKASYDRQMAEKKKAAAASASSPPSKSSENKKAKPAEKKKVTKK